MTPPRSRVDTARSDRKSLRDIAVAIVWIAGLLGFLVAYDGYSMAISLSLMTASAIFIGYRGLPTSQNRRPESSLWRPVRLASLVTLGPLVAAFCKLQTFGLLSDRGLEIVAPILVLAIVLLAADRSLARRA